MKTKILLAALALLLCAIPARADIINVGPNPQFWLAWTAGGAVHIDGQALNYSTFQAGADGEYSFGPSAALSAAIATDPSSIRWAAGFTSAYFNILATTWGGGLTPPGSGALGDAFATGAPAAFTDAMVNGWPGDTLPASAWDNIIAEYGGLLQPPTTAALGESLNFAAFAISPQPLADVTYFSGAWTLGNDGVLNYGALLTPTAPVPEPGALLMLAAGLVPVGWIARRRLAVA